MILEVLETQEPAAFRQALFTTLQHYYEEILGQAGAGGRPKPKHFARKMRDAVPSLASRADSVEAAGGDGESAVVAPPLQPAPAAAAPPAARAADPPPPAEEAAAAPPPPAKAAPTTKGGTKARNGGKP